MFLYRFRTLAKASELYFYTTDMPFPNLLPYDGAAYYYGAIMPAAEAADCFRFLLHHIAWQHEEAIVYGRHIITKRKAAWYGDKPYAYTYSGVTKQALPWLKKLFDLKQLAEEKSGETYNACLLNLYHTGNEGMGWHSDNEATIKKGSAIASLSLGADRTFSFRHKKTKETVACLLENGSLLVMKNETQMHWHHSLPKTKKVKEPRINLTFRSMKE